MPASDLRGAGSAGAPIRLLQPAPVVTRLFGELLRRGRATAECGASAWPRTWIVGPGSDPELAANIAREAVAGRDRILVLGWIGVHPDARAQALRVLWSLEERCRATGLPTLAVRLGPLCGPSAPLWRALAGAAPAGRLARKLVHPVCEADVIEALDRALAGAAAWEAWYEVGGPDVLSLGELAALARASHAAGGGAWEPDRAVLAEQRLIEPEIWARWAGITPASVAAEAGRWAAPALAAS